MSDSFLMDAPKHILADEVRRLHRQRVLMACIIRAQVPREKENDPSAVVQILAELGSIADQIQLELLEDGAYYIACPSDLKEDVQMALVDYLKGGGGW
jgi:hypothetical protein